MKNYHIKKKAEMESREKRILDFENLIFAHFKKHPRLKTKPKKLLLLMNIEQSVYPEVRDAVKNLVKQKKLERFKGNMFGLSLGENLVTGVLKIPSRKGFPFIIDPNGEKITIDEDRLRGAVQDDTVAIQSFPRSIRGMADAKIVKIIKRGRNRVLASYQKLKNKIIAIPEGKQVTQDILIKDHNGFEPVAGDIIDIAITDWKSGSIMPEGKILRIIGNRSSIEYDALLIADQLQIPTEFPSEVTDKANSLKADFPAKEKVSRLDLRKKAIFTIDPEDAKDFDDALSLEFKENGTFEVGVHIADVSAYVERDGCIDKEAYKRGTSVYFTRQVIPMLPEHLSNNLCSLNPKIDRFCLSVIFTMNDKAEILNYKIAESIIHSQHRFTYEDVQKILDTKEGPYNNELQILNKLTDKLYQKRHQAGSIDFDLPDAHYELDEEGLPLNIYKKDRLASHRLIEEFALLANRTITNFVLNKGKKDIIPFIYRIHEEPKKEDIQRLFSLMKSVGLKRTLPKEDIQPKDIQKALEQLSDHPAEKFIEKITLRSMMKAKYSENNCGHFGLAFEHYTHFTSPIRRYPDLIVHRIIKSLIRGLPTNYSLDQVNRICKKSSNTEVRAVTAEREYHKRKQLAYMKDKQDVEFTGTISGVIQYGIFVALDDNFVEGFIHRRELSGDHWEYDKDKYQLKASYSRKIYRLGDTLKVKLHRIDEERGDIDFKLV